MALGWTASSTSQMGDVKDKGYVVPSEGTLFWMDSWVLLADAPNPNAAYALLNFIHEPDIQAKETDYNLYATPNDKAEAARGPGDPQRPGGLPARGRVRAPRGVAGHLGEQPAHRHLGRVQAEHREVTPTARPGGSSAMSSITPPSAQPGSVGGSARACSPAILLLPADPLVPRPAGRPAGDRRRLLVRDAGEEWRVHAGLRPRQLRPGHREVRSAHHQPADGGAGHDRMPARRTALRLLPRDSRRGPKGRPDPPAGRPVLDELPDPHLCMADHPGAGRRTRRPAGDP